MEARARPLRDDGGGDDDNLPSSDRHQQAMPSHKSPTYSSALSPSPAQRALANFAHFLLVFLPSFLPSSFHTPRPDRRPTDRPTDPSVRPSTAPVVTPPPPHALSPSSLARSLYADTHSPPLYRSRSRSASRLALARARSLARSSFALAPLPPRQTRRLPPQLRARSERARKSERGVTRRETKME